MSNKKLQAIFKQKTAVILLLIFCIFLILSGCDACSFGSGDIDGQVDSDGLGDVGSQEVEADYDNVVMIYMCGSTLESRSGYASKSIAEILGAVSGERDKIILQTGGSKYWHGYDISPNYSSRYSVSDGQLVLEEYSDAVNMGSASSLSSFLSFGIQNYSAEQYSLIFYNHGGGSLGGVCFDEQFNSDALTLDEIDTALSGTVGSLGIKLRFVGFDACLMATLDTAVMLSNYSDYMIGSQEIEPSRGWDYATLIQSAITCDSDQEMVKNICDSYLEKYSDSSKYSYVTLSAVDLSKIDAVKDEFNSVMTKLLDKLENGATVAYYTVRAGLNAEAFGGVSVIEGKSDLVDFYNFSCNLSENFSEASTLCEKIDDAICYNVSGQAREGASGLSLFYPFSYNQSNLSEYLTSCKIDAYKEYLQSSYSEVGDTTIEFEDYGSEASDGSFEIKLTQDSLKYVRTVDFVMIEALDDLATTMYGLGQDNDIFQSEDGQVYNSNFRGVWITFAGHKLCVVPIDETENYILFSAPIICNGEQTNLRFSFTFDDTYTNGGYYSVLGTWQGIDTYGMSDRNIKALEVGDVVQILYNEINVGDIASSLQVGGQVTINQDNCVVEELPLSQQSYQYVYKITDIFGSVFYSSTAMFKMQYSYEELLQNPLNDGEFAGTIITIASDVDNDLAYGKL